MKLHQARCPNCFAPLKLYRETERCRCEHCETEFVIEWESSGGPTLTALAAILGQVEDRTRFLEAGQRLQYIGNDLRAAGTEVANMEEMVAWAELRVVAAREQKTRELLSTAATTVALAVIAILLFGIGVLRVGEGKWGWYMVGAGLAGIGAWVAVEQLRTDLVAVCPELQRAEENLAEAQEHLGLARAKLLDILLERKYCQQVARSYRVRR